MYIISYWIYIYIHIYMCVYIIYTSYNAISFRKIMLLNLIHCPMNFVYLIINATVFSSSRV